MPSAARPHDYRPHPTAAHQVHVQMVDFLAAIAIAIDDEPVAALGDALLLSDLSRRQQQTPRHLFVLIRQVIHRGDLFIGNDQNMDRGQRANIPKCGHQFVLINDGPRQLAADYPGKDAGQRAHSFCGLGRISCLRSVLPGLWRLCKRQSLL